MATAADHRIIARGGDDFQRDVAGGRLEGENHETLSDQISLPGRVAGGVARGNRRFIAAVEADQALNGRIAYRCMKADNGSSEYYHLAAAADEAAAKELQQRDFFKAYTEETKRVSGGNGRGVAARDHRGAAGETVARASAESKLFLAGLRAPRGLESRSGRPEDQAISRIRHKPDPGAFAQPGPHACLPAGQVSERVHLFAAHAARLRVPSLRPERRRRGSFQRPSPREARGAGTT